MGTKQTTIVLVAKDLASGNIKRVSQELSQLGPGGKLAAVGLGTTMAATSGVERGLSHLKGTVGNLASGIGVLAGGAGVLGLAGALTSATSQATSFQSSMELIATQAGASQQEVESMTQAVLKLSPSVATGPNELAQGLYHIESAGLRGAKALDVLTAAAQGAKVGNADLESVTNALIAATNSGIKGTTSMTQAMGVLNAIVGAGNMRMQDLTDAMSTGILSSAKTFGVSIQSVGAAIADMTNQGVPAIDAATRLRMTLSLLAAPTSKAATEFKAVGLGQFDLANAMRGPGGILAAVKLLSEHMQKAGLIDASGNVKTAGADMLSKAFGGGRSSSAIMTLVGSIEKYQVIQDQVTKGAGSFGDAWAKTQEDAAFKFEKFQAAMSTMLIDLGNAVLPTMTDAASAIGDFISQNQAQIADSFKNAVATIRAVAGTVISVVKPMFEAIKGAWGMLPGPLQQLLIGGFVANKASKFLFGMSPVSGIKDLIGLATKGGGLGSILGGLTSRGGTPANPVFTADVTGGAASEAGAIGFMKGGGLKGVIAGAVAFLPAAMAGSLAVLLGQQFLQQSAEISQQGTQVVNRAGSWVKTASTADLTNALNQISEQKAGNFGLNALALGLTDPFNHGLENLDKTQQEIRDELAARVRNPEQDIRAQQGADAARQTNAELAHIAYLQGEHNSYAAQTAVSVAGSVRVLDTLHADLQKQLGALKSAKDPKEIAAAAAAIAKDVLAGAGGVASTGNILNRLKAERASATDPALIKALDGAIAKVADRLDARKFVAAQEAAADKIMRSNLSSADKITALQPILRSLDGHSQVGMAHVASEIDSLKPHIDALRTGISAAIVAGLKAAGLSAPSAQYQPGGLGPAVHLTVHPPGVSARQNNVADAQWRRFSPNNRTAQAQ